MAMLVRWKSVVAGAKVFLVVGTLWGSIASHSLLAQDKGPDGKKETSEQAVKTVPPLSVESLFKPDERFDYFGPMPPTTQWLDNSTLAIREGDQWQVLDPASGERSPWQWPGELRAELQRLPGFSEKAIDAAVRQSLGSQQDLSKPFLVRIGSSLAVAGGQFTPPQLIARDPRGWQDPELSPDGSSVAFVRDHDLYVVKIATGEVLRLTQDGSPTLLNGRLDWTYQEEIYGRGNFKGFWWSPDSKHLAYLKIDISAVLPYTVTGSSTPRGEAMVTPYPKAGDPIPLAQLVVVDTSSLQSTVIHSPQGEDAETLVVRVTWRPDGRFITYQIQNRIQSWLELREADLAANQPRVLVREEGPAWIEILGEPHWLPDGDFLWLSDLPAGRRHVWRVSADGSRRVPVTSGDWDVREILRVLPDQHVMFVAGDQLQGGKGQQAYRVDLYPTNSQPHATPTATVQVLTDGLGWHAVSVSPNGNYLADTHSSLTEEPIKWLVALNDEMKRTPLHSPESAPWKLLKLPEPKWLDITTEDGVPLPAYLIAPSGASETNSSKQFPVLIYTYGGPQAASAVDRWNGRNFLFHQLLVSHGIGVMVVDNRSSNGRGIADTWSIYRQMGVQELKDLLVAVEALKQHPWVDGGRLAIRGWSFGGFYTSYAMTHSDVFRAGIAGGSVTDWRNYDAFYTERYMDTPQANAEGYKVTSVVEKAADLQGRLLLIHGEVDDNVHLGNTLQLVAALQEAGKMFDLMVYPSAAHGVTRPTQVYHLHKLMFEFLKKELQ